jgi:hypothetical protein
MKYGFKMLLLLATFMVFTFNASAVYYGDERDNPKDMKEDEVRITLFDDLGEAPDTPVSDDLQFPDVEFRITDDSDEVHVTEDVKAISTDGEVTTQSDDNSLFTNLLFGLSGLLLGSLATYFMFAKRQ